MNERIVDGVVVSADPLEVTLLHRSVQMEESESNPVGETKLSLREFGGDFGKRPEDLGV